ncbi:hypothetical protein [Bifidobacterium lemurum]|nr:hypothetical protein [Bifidobacterium lemurum]QOL33628.1 hypothetical protein BL8807_07455 [Bifidobacterium lemurum]
MAEDPVIPDSSLRFEELLVSAYETVGETYAPARPDAESVNAIVDRALPQRVRLRDLIADTVRMLSVRNLFFGVGDCVFLAVMCGGMVWGLLAMTFLVQAGSEQAAATAGIMTGSPDVGLVVDATVSGTTSDWRVRALFVPTFVLSPLIYEFVHLLISFKERSLRTAQVLRACRWSFRRIAAMRMLVFGGISMVGSTVFSVTVAWMSSLRFDLLTLLGLSFAALFLFAFGQLLVDMHVRWPASNALMPALWAVLSIGMIWHHASVEPWLAGLPPVLTIGLAFCAAIAYFAALRRYCAIRPTEFRTLAYGTERSR